MALEKKKPVPTDAQAKMLANMFGTGFVYKAGEWSGASWAAIIKNGWVSPNGEKGEMPSGAAFVGLAINEDGIDALETYLFKRRCKRDA